MRSRAGQAVLPWVATQQRDLECLLLRRRKLAQRLVEHLIEQVAERGKGQLNLASCHTTGENGVALFTRSVDSGSVVFPIPGSPSMTKAPKSVRARNRSSASSSASLPTIADVPVGTKEG
jgi:hypothetical protein